MHASFGVCGSISILPFFYSSPLDRCCETDRLARHLRRTRRAEGKRRGLTVRRSETTLGWGKPSFVQARLFSVARNVLSLFLSLFSLLLSLSLEFSSSLFFTFCSFSTFILISIMRTCTIVLSPVPCLVIPISRFSSSQFFRFTAGNANDHTICY